MLDRVKALSLLPDGMHVTTAMVAAYFGSRSVPSDARRRDELRQRVPQLDGDGTEFLSGDSVGSSSTAVSSLALWLPSRRPQRRHAPPRQRRRTSGPCVPPRHGVPGPHAACGEPCPRATAPPLDDRIDQRITHILGKTVVPMFNALIETSGEHRQELIALRAGCPDGSSAALRQHHARSPTRTHPRTAPVRRSHGRHRRHERPRVRGTTSPTCCAATAAPTSSCTAAPETGAVDITGRTADGRTRRRPVQEIRALPLRHQPRPPEVHRRGQGAPHRRSVALFVATCPFTRDALNVADRPAASPPYTADCWRSGAPGAALAVLE